MLQISPCPSGHQLRPDPAQDGIKSRNSSLQEYRGHLILLRFQNHARNLGSRSKILHIPQYLKFQKTMQNQMLSSSPTYKDTSMKNLYNFATTGLTLSHARTGVLPRKQIEAQLLSHDATVQDTGNPYTKSSRLNFFWVPKTMETANFVMLMWVSNFASCSQFGKIRRQQHERE